MAEIDKFDGLKGDATHTRAVHYQRGEFWIVVDRIETDRERTLQPLWHFHPDCTVETAGSTASSTDPDRGNLRIVPAGDIDWDVELIRGQESPHPMGWYSPDYGEALPTTVASYEADIAEGTTTFAWLILPAEDAAPEAGANLIEADPAHATVRVRIGEKDARNIRIQLQ